MLMEKEILKPQEEWGENPKEVLRLSEVSPLVGEIIDTLKDKGLSENYPLNRGREKEMLSRAKDSDKKGFVEISGVLGEGVAEKVTNTPIQEKAE